MCETNEYLSNCCGATWDRMWSYENGNGVCSKCKENAEFYDEEDNKEYDDEVIDPKEFAEKNKSFLKKIGIDETKYIGACKTDTRIISVVDKENPTIVYISHDYVSYSARNAEKKA